MPRRQSGRLPARDGGSADDGGRFRGVVVNPRGLAAIAAGVIHLAVVGEHLAEYPPFGVLFAVLATFQGAWAVAYIARPRTPLAVVAVAVNAGATVVWALSRTTGLPIGPGPWIPEAVGALDVQASAIEAALVVVLGVNDGRKLTPFQRSKTDPSRRLITLRRRLAPSRGHGPSVEADDHGVVNEAVNHRRGDRRVPEHLAPAAERLATRRQQSNSTSRLERVSMAIASPRSWARGSRARPPRPTPTTSTKQDRTPGRRKPATAGRGDSSTPQSRGRAVEPPGPQPPCCADASQDRELGRGRCRRVLDHRSGRRRPDNGREAMQPGEHTRSGA